MNIFGTTGQERRAWLNDQGENALAALQYYLGPGVPVENVFRIADAFNPVADIGRAGTSARGVVRPDATIAERIGALGDMSVDIASVLAPVAGVGYADDAVGVLEDALMGMSFGAREFGRHAGMVANQPGPLTATGDDTLGAFRVWHGSPHDFDRFSMDKIGTGEGAQAYGHGLYFAESPKVAQSYRDALSNNRMMSQTMTVDGVDWFDAPQVDRSALQEIYPLIQETGSVDGALSILRDRAQNSPVTYLRIRSGDLADYLEKNAGRIGYQPKGRLYEVNIDANPEDFLDWDYSGLISDMPEGPQKDVLTRWASGFGMDPSKTQANQVAGLARSEVGSRRLREAGIPGIRYLDAGSRGAGDGSRNFVVFDEDLITILNKYGLAGLAAGGAGYSMAPEEQY